MQETFIKLDRSLLRHRYFDNTNVLKIWLWCLLKASHAPHQQLVGLQTVKLQPGDFVTGRDSAARDLKMSGSTAWTILKLLERDKKIVIKSNNKFSIISVIDFYSYQVLKYQSRQQNRQQTDNNLTTNGQQPDTNKNEKNEKNEKNDNKRFVPPTLEEVAAYCAERKNNIDPQSFMDHYETRGWIPKGYTQQMKSWKAAVRTWEKNDNGRHQSKQPPKTFTDIRSEKIVEAMRDFVGEG